MRRGRGYATNENTTTIQAEARKLIYLRDTTDLLEAFLQRKIRTFRFEKGQPSGRVLQTIRDPITGQTTVANREVFVIMEARQVGTMSSDFY